jgi:cation transport ATPase
MSIFDIVVGDIILVFRGEKIPADGLFCPGLEGIDPVLAFLYFPAIR